MMSRATLEHWEARYASGERPPDWDPDPWIIARAASLPPGVALDVACGWGRHALWLAQRGHRVLGIDGSITALHGARAESWRRGIEGEALFVQADLDNLALQAGSFDLVVVVRFLERALAPRLAALLKPRGVLLYATFTLRRLDSHPQFNPDYLLAPGELPRLFSHLKPLQYEESGECAYLFAQHP